MHADTLGEPRIVLKDWNTLFGINNIAHGQIAEQAKIPKSYYDRMRAEAPHLLANNVNEWFTKYPTLKRGMPPNAALGIVPHCPPEVLRRLPQWLAQGEGKDAEWVYAPSATVANWEANAELKEKKATQTLKAAEDPRYIARYLREHGYNSLMAIEHG